MHEQPRDSDRLTRVYLHLDRLTHNLRLLERLAGGAALWPVVKANAYGHGALPVVRHLITLGHRFFCVADVSEAAALHDGLRTDPGAAGEKVTFLVLSATLPEHAAPLVRLGCEPVVCTEELATALSAQAVLQQRKVALHVKIDTGMGRVGIAPEGVLSFLEHCRGLPGLEVRGLMSHFAGADEQDKSGARVQLDRFRSVVAAVRALATPDTLSGLLCHMSNSAGLLELPAAHFDAVRPGIALWGLPPSAEIANPLVRELQPVLEWKTRITFLKEVPAGVGLSYGHTYHTPQPALIATLPVGYADGLPRTLSGRLEVLIGGVRCPQVGRVTMDMILVDVSVLRGRVSNGDEAVLIGSQGGETITAEAVAGEMGTINYEILASIAHRVPRVVVP